MLVVLFFCLIAQNLSTPVLEPLIYGIVYKQQQLHSKTGK